MGYKNILVGLCGRVDEKLVIEEAIKIMKSNNAEVTFMHINDPHAGEMSMMMDATPPKYTEADVHKWVSAIDELIANGSTITILASESIPQAIIEGSVGKDLIVLGHRKQSFFKEHFFDSVDEGIVNKADCPVLVVPK